MRKKLKIKNKECKHKWEIREKDFGVPSHYSTSGAIVAFRQGLVAVCIKCLESKEI